MSNTEFGNKLSLHDLFGTDTPPLRMYREYPLAFSIERPSGTVEFHPLSDLDEGSALMLLGIFSALAEKTQEKSVVIHTAQNVHINTGNFED